MIPGTCHKYDQSKNNENQRNGNDIDGVAIKINEITMSINEVCVGKMR